MMTNINLPCDSITAITDAWYNQLAGSLNLSINNFQLIQPLAIAKDDESLWAYFNTIPPPTLKYNYWLYNQPSFFSQYAAVINQLAFPDSTFRKDIGAANYARWTVYLKSLSPQPPANTLPTVWFQWAMINAPSVANIGRTDLSYQLLINSGQAALKPYEGSNAKPVDYLPSFSYLTTTLRASPPTNFSFNSLNDNPNVSKSWIPGYDPNFFGLWTGSWCGLHLNKKFALSTISITVSFDHFCVVPITPGAWYNSGLLHLALVSKTTPPWTTPANWDEYFGSDGTFNYAIGSVLAVDGITLNLTSDADFTADEQILIKAMVEMGYWPLYSLQQSSIITNNISFESGKMTIQVQSTPGNPILIGNNVFGINQYLGGS